MAFTKFQDAELDAGKTIPLVLDMLPGEPPPVVHIEHLGEENRTYLADQIAQANAKTARTGNRATKELMSKEKIKQANKRRRDEVQKHVIRALEAKHDDGRIATAEDIPEFVASLPQDVVDTIYFTALNVENFRRYAVAAASKEEIDELAEK